MTPAEKKKAVWLGGAVGVLGLYSIYTNFLSEPSVPSSHVAAVEKGAPDGGAMAMDHPAGKASRPKGNSRARSDDFNPPYIANRPEDRPDTTRIDPTLRLDYFAKVQEVDPAGGKRNLFAFGQPPPPPPPPKAVAELPKGPEPKVDITKIKQDDVKIHEREKELKSDPPLHTNLKYYGVVAVSQSGQKTACMLDKGEEIVLATEGEVVSASNQGGSDKKLSLRVTKIGTAEVTVQDTDSKKQEKLTIQPEAKEKS
jgi:hypothetical protein